MPRPPYGICLPVRIVSVHDGDTLTVKLADPDSPAMGLLEWTVRLLSERGGCWAPETDKPLEKARGIQARDYVRKVTAGARDVSLFVPLPEAKNLLARLTTLGRLLGRVYIGDQCLGSQLIRAGLAWETKEALREASENWPAHAK